MERLKALIEQYGRWKPLLEYVQRIETYRDSDFTLVIENAKSLLESVAKEICKQRKQEYSDDSTTGKLLKLAFTSLGYNDTNTVRQVSGAIANIGQQMGNLRNEIGKISHGRSLEELESRTIALDEVSSEFLISSAELVCCFLIQLFETEYPRRSIESVPIFDEHSEFNDFLDETYGEITIGINSYSASQILYSMSPTEYIKALLEYEASLDGTDH